MKKAILIEHSILCRGHCTPCNFLFQFDYEFYLITYPQCQEYYSHLDLKESFLNQVCELKDAKNSEISNEINRGYKEYKVHKEMDLDNLLRRKKKEICFLYKDNANAIYCMYKQSKYTDYLINSSGYYDNYMAAKLEIDTDKVFNLSDYSKEYYNELLSNLFYSNNPYIEYKDERQELLLTDLLTKKILSK